MILNKGEVIELDIDQFDFDCANIDKISYEQEDGVYDITTESGFFQDINNIIHKQCSSHSLEYIKKYGLDGLGNLDSVSSPAKHARSLSVHLNTFLASMQMYYAGALGIGYINIFYAPYIENMNDEEIYQEAQHLIFQTSQNAFTRGGSALFIDFNIHTGIPNYLKKIKAIGPGGKYTGKTYGEYEDAAIKFTKALLKVWGKGDANGSLFSFPKCFDENTMLFCKIDDKYETVSLLELYDYYNKGHNVLLLGVDKFVNVTNMQKRPENEDGIELVLSENIRLKSLPDHKYLVADGMEIIEKMASELTEDDILLKIKDHKKQSNDLWDKFDLLEVKQIDKCKVNAIALEVEGHVFVTASGVVTKNCDFHVNYETFSDPKQKEVFDYACKIASKNGIIYFVFDRDEVTLSACCRLRTTISDNYMINHPESMRYTGFQNVTINLPQCAYRSDKDLNQFYKELEDAFNICVKAHLEKKKFAQKLMSTPGTPLWQVGKIAKDGKPYVDLEKATYIIGLIGLNETIDYLIGKELHTDDQSLMFGLRVISYLYFLVKEAGSKYGLKFSLEETPAESASRRLSKIDLYNYPDKAIVRGSIEDDQTYYTNSIHIRPDANVDLLTRIVSQSKFHNLIESGAIIHAFVGEKLPSAKSIANIIEKTFKNTNAAQLTISPEFTVCGNCNKTILGLNNNCKHCGSSNINIEYCELEKLPGEWDKKLLDG